MGTLTPSPIGDVGVMNLVVLVVFSPEGMVRVEVASPAGGAILMAVVLGKIVLDVVIVRLLVVAKLVDVPSWCECSSNSPVDDSRECRD